MIVQTYGSYNEQRDKQWTIGLRGSASIRQFTMEYFHDDIKYNIKGNLNVISFAIDMYLTGIIMN